MHVGVREPSLADYTYHASDKRPVAVDGGLSLSNPVHYASPRRLHKWAAAHLGSDAAPPYFPRHAAGAMPVPSQHAFPSTLLSPRAVESPRTQRTVSLAYPLCSQADEVINPPSVWQRAAPTAAVFRHLAGAGADSPRLAPEDRTVYQPKQDVSRGTSYTLDYCRPSAMRTAVLPPIARRDAQDDTVQLQLSGRTPTEVHRAARFGVLGSGPTDPFQGTGTAHLDPRYDPSQHGTRSIIPPATHVFVR